MNSIDFKEGGVNLKKHAQRWESELETGSYDLEIAEKKHVRLKQFSPETGLRIVIMAEKKTCTAKGCQTKQESRNWHCLGRSLDRSGIFNFAKSRCCLTTVQYFHTFSSGHSSLLFHPWSSE